MRKIDLIKNAMPLPLFRRLVQAVRAVGTERMEDMGSYNTTFWFPRDAKPTNIVEECVSKLCVQVRPGPRCIGMEWWLGRLKYGESLPFHTDRDRSLRKQTGVIVHPLWSSILYLNRFPSSPTVVFDQVLVRTENRGCHPNPNWAGRSPLSQTIMPFFAATCVTVSWPTDRNKSRRSALPEPGSLPSCG